MKQINNIREDKLKSEKGSISLLVAVTIFTFVTILMGTYLTISILRQSQYESDARIQKVYGEDVNRIDEIYEQIAETMQTKPIQSPEKSEESAFDRTYGVIEVEFLNGTGYEIADEPNAPRITNDMKKVYWEEDGTERIEGNEGFDESKWYSYTAQTSDTASGGTSKWANAVTFDGDGNIDAYWVWIPRYAYRIVYFDSQEHENAYRKTGATQGIVGYSDSRGFVHPDGTTPSDMEKPVTSISVGTNKLRPHPAFEDGSQTGYTQGEWNTTLEGIWIAKYETSGASDALKSVPGVQALTNVTIGDMYTYALNYSKTKNSHMLKNSEWGAVAYLTESKYGRNGTPVTSNNQNQYTAGIEGGTVASNQLQSTTGNYYGIYDTVGGNYEYTAGYISNNSQNFGNSFASIDNTYNNKTTSTEYVTVYDMVDAQATQTQNYNLNINKKFGDAIIEISTAGTGVKAWNSSHSLFFGLVNNFYGPFILRGGKYDHSNVGIFFFNYFNGAAMSETTFRLAISI